MDLAGFRDTPHRRYNPLIREWMLVSPHRTLRPWQGKVEKVSAENAPAYDPSCYLCPGNERARGNRNPQYKTTFVFDNDYAALLPDPGEATLEHRELIVASTERGICRVGCFSPRHDLTIPRMSVGELRPVVDMWIDQYRELGSTPWVRHVQVFENRGAMMGASNPHPHCQIWGTGHIPNQSTREQMSLAEYREKNAGCMLCEYGQLEHEMHERIVCENDGFTILVPFWAIWPYETMLISKRHVGSMADFNENERNLLADILRQVTIRYDNLFETSFPYSMGFHQQPTDGQSHPEWHLHAHYYPPLLRSATIQKFMVGYEMLAMPQRDITPETAAERLRQLSPVHYLSVL